MSAIVPRWTRHQQRAIDCIACQAGILVRRIQYISADRVVAMPRDRFNTNRLASRLARTLRAVQS